MELELRGVTVDPEIRSGKPVISGTRIGVADVVSALRRNEGSVAATAEEYDVSVDQIHAALIYYALYPTEIDAILDERREFYQRGLASQRAPARG